VPVGAPRHLTRAIGGPRARALDAHAPAAAPDLAGLVAVAHRRPVGIAAAIGPTTSSTSSSSSSANTPSPTPTERASSPSFAAPASSPRAYRTRAGSAPKRSRSPVASAAWSTVLMAVLPSPMDDFALATRAARADEAGYKVLRATRQPRGPARTQEYTQSPPARVEPRGESHGREANR
jgi:hypothetical protein